MWYICTVWQEIHLKYYPNNLICIKISSKRTPEEDPVQVWSWCAHKVRKNIIDLLTYGGVVLKNILKWTYLGTPIFAYNEGI
jgi:hypothetical protein